MSSDPPPTVVTRFAPSPTGELHVGGARTALLNWAYARHHDGQFIIRLEDTDQARSSAESAKSILRDLQWLGLDWDQGPRAEADDPLDPVQHLGDQGPYCQSKRLSLYNEMIEQLMQKGHAYVPNDAPEIVRFTMGRDVEFEDQVFGHIHVGARELEDFVIRKSDGFPTFHLAVVVDDALMGVTHVIRGQEHLSNTAKHVALFDALGLDRPTFAHMPSIMNPDGSKMSKRDKAKAARQAISEAARAQDARKQNDPESSPPDRRLTPDDQVTEPMLQAFVDKQDDSTAIARWVADRLGATLPEIDVDDFHRSGYLPGVLCNYIALLGWNPGDDVERFDLDFLVQHFTLDRVNKANSRFDRQKLAAFNAETIRQMPAEDWARLLYHESPDDYGQWFGGADDPRFVMFAAAYQPRSTTLRDPVQLGAFFFADDASIAYDPKAVKKVLSKNDGEGLTMLRHVVPVLETVQDWQCDPVHEAIEKAARQHEVNMGKVAQPLRVAVSGSTVSPPIDQTLVILGRQATLSRIAHCLKVCGS